MMSPEIEEACPQPASSQGPGCQLLSLLHELHQKPKTRAPPTVTLTERWSRMIWATPKSYLQPLQAQKHSCALQRHTVKCTGQPASSNHAKVERARAHGYAYCLMHNISKSRHHPTHRSCIFPIKTIDVHCLGLAKNKRPSGLRQRCRSHLPCVEKALKVQGSPSGRPLWRISARTGGSMRNHGLAKCINLAIQVVSF
jgi:hypothetical protein